MDKLTVLLEAGGLNFFMEIQKDGILKKLFYNKQTPDLEISRLGFGPDPGSGSVQKKVPDPTSSNTEKA